MRMKDNPFPAKAFEAGGYSHIWFALFTCDACGYAVLGKIDFDFEAMYQYLLAHSDDPRASLVYNTLGYPHTVLACNVFDTQPSAIQWIPANSIGKEYEDVPKDIASAASEAYSCFSINANRAAVLLARTALEATAKDKGITDGSLNKKIDKMAEKGIITDQLAQEAHEIRLLGNDMAHGDLGTPVEEDDASDILGFLDSVLDYVYQQPIAIQKRQDLRKRRKQEKH